MAELQTHWLGEQFQRMLQRQPDLAEKALLRAFQEDADFRWAIVVDAYLDGQINLGKAAELLGMHRLELQKRFLEMGIPLRLGPRSREEAHAEVEAWRQWKQKDHSR